MFMKRELEKLNGDIKELKININEVENTLATHTRGLLSILGELNKKCDNLHLVVSNLEKRVDSDHIHPRTDFVSPLDFIGKQFDRFMSIFRE